MAKHKEITVETPEKINYILMRRQMLEKGISYSDLARGTGLNRDTVRALTKSSNPKLKQIMAIAQFLGIEGGYRTLLTPDASKWRA